MLNGRPLFIAIEPVPLAFMPEAGLNNVCKLNTAYRLSPISCLPRRPMNEVLTWLAPTPKYEPWPPFRETSVSSGPPGDGGERRAVLDIGQAHIEVAVYADTLDADVVVLDGLCLDRCLVGQVGCHRVDRIDGRHDGLLRFKRLLALLDVGETLGHRRILFAELLGLSLDIRQLVGMGCRRCKSQDGCC